MNFTTRRIVLGGGVGRPSLDLDFLTGTLDPRISFTRTGLYGTATYFDGAGVMRNSAVNQMTLSTDFAAWSNTGGATTLTNNAALAPNGTLTAARSDTGDTISGIHHSFKAFTSGAVSTPYVGSVYAKADQYTRFALYFGNTAFASINTGGLFDLANGTVVATANGSTCTIVHVGDGWYRLTCTATSDADGGNYLLVCGFMPAAATTIASVFTPASTGLGGWLFGAQVEVGTVATPYIPTGAAINGAPRFDYDPSTLAPRGLLIEEARTNSIRNTTMVGAVAGTPGTPPTNWTIAAAGVTIQLVGTGTINGLPYIDYRISGTTSGVFGQITLDTATAIPAVNGQVWATSFWVALVGGSLTNVSSMSGSLNMRDAGGVSLASVTGIANFVSSITSTLTRISGAGTLTNASTAFLMPILGWGWSSGVALDFTIRIAAPQLELGAFATSFIPTSTVAVTRAVDVTSMPLGTWWVPLPGSMTVEADVHMVASPTGNSCLLIDDGTNNNRLILRNGAGLSQVQAAYVSGGSATSTAAPSGSLTSGVPFEIGASALPTGVTCANSMGSVSGFSAGAAPIGPTTMRFGQNTAGGAFMSGHIRRVRYWPKALSDPQLQSVTR